MILSMDLKKDRKCLLKVQELQQPEFEKLDTNKKINSTTILEEWLVCFS